MTDVRRETIDPSAGEARVVRDDPLAEARSASDGQARSSPLTELVVQIGVGVVLGWLAVVVGAIVTVVGFTRVSTSDSLAEQFAYFSSGCVGGIVFIGVGACGVLTSQYADLARAARATTELIRAGELPSKTADESSHLATDEVFVLEGSSSFHSSSCPFLVGRPVHLSSRGDAERDGLTACSACWS